MKKLILVIVSVILLSGCGSEPAKVEEPIVSETPAVTSAPTLTPTSKPTPTSTPQPTTETTPVPTKKPETVYQEPAYTEPPYQESVSEEPVYQEPVYQEPVNTDACPGGIDPSQPCDALIDRAGNATASNGYWKGSIDACVAAGEAALENGTAGRYSCNPLSRNDNEIWGWHLILQ